MSKIAYSTLNSFLKTKIADANLFTRTVSIALGVSLARLAALPTSAPESARAFYAEQIQPGIEQQAVSFNEGIVVDLDLTWQVARSIWMVRCGLAHPPALLELPQEGTPGDFLVGMSGCSYVLDKAIYDFLNANKEVIYVIMNRICSTMNEVANPQVRQA